MKHLTSPAVRRALIAVVVCILVVLLVRPVATYCGLRYSDQKSGSLIIRIDRFTSEAWVLVPGRGWSHTPPPNWNSSLHPAVAPPAEVGRYQLVTVKHTALFSAFSHISTTKDSEAVMVDTSTGQIWQWLESHTVDSDMKKPLHLQGWRRMYVEGINEQPPYSH